MISPAVSHRPAGRGISTVLSHRAASSCRTRRKSSPLLLLNAPGTFSQTAKAGYFPCVLHLISRMIRTASKNRLERSPDNPARFPAMLKSWQGEPNVITSTGLIFPPSIRVISPKCSILASSKQRLLPALGDGFTVCGHLVKVRRFELTRDSTSPLLQCYVRLRSNPAKRRVNDILWITP